MAHKILRLANKHLYNMPLLSTQQQVEELTDYVDKRGTDLAVAKEVFSKMETGELGEGSIAVIPITGPLTYEETGWEALCGMSSYQGILGMTRQAIKEGYKTIVFDHDSGGGEAFGAFETAQDIKRMTSEAGVKTIAYVDGLSASAAYALAVAADEIIMNPYSEVGSVGVVTQLRNTSEKDKKEGVKNTFVFAGDSKIPFDANGDFTKSFIDDLQVKVDSLYESFLTHVSEMRGIGKEAVRSTQAKVFSAEKALEINFVDRVMSRNEFAEYLADIEEDGDKMSLKSLNLTVNEEKKKMQLEEMQKTLEAAVADKEEALSQLANIQEQLSAKESEMAELQSSVEDYKSQLEAVKKETEQKEMASRKEKLSQVLASDRVDSVFEAVKGLDSDAFEAVVASYEANNKALENSELFKENGVDAEAAKTEDEVSPVMALIKQRKAK